MTPTLSQNTQAILLLTAPLIAGRGTSSADLLSPAEYKRLARHLRELQRQPADLLAPGAAELLRACHSVVDEQRLSRLLERGFLLSQVIERWQARAIWVVSRADAEYPRRLKARLREDAPPVLYGCGSNILLETGGLAVVGSRHVEDALISYTLSIGRLAARAGRTLVSGGAKGIDQAAMRGALDAGGRVCGVLADSLEKAAMNRDNRNLLLDEQLVLISPYDPNAGFNVGNAMQRNKLIYALADAALVVSSDLNKGGTWNGATEQLDRLKFVTVYVRATGEQTPGLLALQRKGALPWPDPEGVDSFQSVFGAKLVPAQPSSQPNLSLLVPSASGQAESAQNSTSHRVGEPNGEEKRDTEAKQSSPPLADAVPPQNGDDAQSGPSADGSVLQGTGAEQASAAPSPAQTLFDAVRTLVRRLLKRPMTEREIAAALDVSATQAKTWLRRLVDEGMLEKHGIPAGYVVKQDRLLH